MSFAIFQFPNVGFSFDQYSAVGHLNQTALSVGDGMEFVIVSSEVTEDTSIVLTGLGGAGGHGHSFDDGPASTLLKLC